jgi:hypothetical protein
MTPSTQNQPGKSLAFNMLRVVPTTIEFLLLTPPFCCGEYGTINWWNTPSIAQFSTKVFELNSPPQPVRKARSFQPDSTLALN